MILGIIIGTMLGFFTILYVAVLLLFNSHSRFYVFLSHEIFLQAGDYWSGVIHHAIHSVGCSRRGHSEYHWKWWSSGRVCGRCVLLFIFAMSPWQFNIGCAISWDGDFKIHVEGDVFWSVIDLALNSVCFVYLGAWMPFESFNSPALGITPWRLIVLLMAILLLRRIPALLLLYKWIPETNTWQEALFCGHFGALRGLTRPWYLC
jgi:Sodium/hydrogen exchanger family